jgi:hypothetical protein
MMLWEPGFVVQFPEETYDYQYDFKLNTTVPGKGMAETLVVTARRRGAGSIELEIWYCCAAFTIPLCKATLQEGEELSRARYPVNQESSKWAVKTGRGLTWFNAFAVSRIKMATTQLGHTLRLLQCKNVGLVEQQNPPCKRRRGKLKASRQVESYWVLDLPGSPRYWDRSSGQTGIHSRLHVVRGHFKTYTEEAPLFGKMTGTIWVPSHARGDASLGLIEKDYNLLGQGEKRSDAA